MAEDTAQKTLLKELKTGRDKTVNALDKIIDQNKVALAGAKAGSDEAKKAAKNQLKAAKARDSLLKQDISLAGDLKKNFKDIGSTITGGLEGMMSEAFGPLGGIAASLTTGFFKRGAEKRKDLESNTMELGSTDELVAELQQPDKDKVKKDGGEQADIEDTAESVEETAGGVSETVAELDYSNQWLEEIAGHLEFISANTPTIETQEERMKRDGGKPEKKGKKGKKEDEGFSLMNLGTTVIAAISGALMGAVAGLSLGFVNMWGSIFKFFGGKLAKMFPKVTKILSDIFGKGGKISQFVTSIKAFFTESKAFKTISEAFTKFKTTLSNFGKTIKSFFKPILDIFSSSAKGSSALGGISRFKKVFMTFFRVFKSFFAKLFLPLQVIISLFDGFFEAKDAAGKSEGMLATFFNSIIGFFGGILDGFVMGTLDLIKGAVAWIAGFLGFGDVEDSLDSFSFSDTFNEFLDDIYKWFNLLFSDPVAALTNLFAGYFGAALSIGDFVLDMIKKPLVWIMGLFGWDEAAEATEKFSLTGTVTKAFDSVVKWFKNIFQWGKKAAFDGKGFSITKLITEAVDAIAKWFGDLFNKITNFDFANFAKGLLPSFLADMIFGTAKAPEKPAEAKKAETAAQGGESEKLLEKPDTGGMFDAILNPFRTYVKGLLADTTGIPDWVENIVLSAIPGGDVPTVKDGGFIVSRPTYLPSSGVVVGEHPTWKGKNHASKGSAGQKEMVVPFESGEGQAVLAPFSKSIAGAVMNNLAMDRVGLGGNGGGNSGSTTVDSSTQQVITNNTIINSPEPQGPVLPGAGRDHAISHFRHVA